MTVSLPCHLAGYRARNTGTCRLRTQVHSSSQAQGNFFLLLYFKIWRFFLHLCVLFLEATFFISEKQNQNQTHPALSLMKPDVVFWISWVLNRYRTLCHKAWWAGKIQGGVLWVARVQGWVGVTREISGGHCHISILIGSAVNVRDRFARTFKGVT